MAVEQLFSNSNNNNKIEMWILSTPIVWDIFRKKHADLSYR